MCMTIEEKEAIKCPGPGDSGSCELSIMGACKWTLVLWECALLTTELFSPSPKFIMSTRNAGTGDGAETKWMANQQPAQLETHPMGKH